MPVPRVRSVPGGRRFARSGRPGGEERKTTVREVVPVAYRVEGCRSGRRCPCGAVARNGGMACQKCAARARWSRRKMRRGFDDD